MGSRKEEERNEKIIRGLMKLPPNRKCINCNSVGPQYVCTNFWTFTCLSCSGIQGEPESSTPGDMFPGFNVSPGVLGELSYPAPIQHQLGMSQAAKSTNPFDMAFESDIEANDMFMDLNSLQATLPDPHVPAEYSENLAESWISQNSTVPYIPSVPHGGLSYIPGQVQDPHMLNSTQQGHFPSRNPFE